MMPWQHLAPTAKQLKALDAFGADISAVTTKGLASHLLDRLFDRKETGMASLRQIRLMQKMGHEHALEATAQEAQAFLGGRFSRYRNERA